MTSTRSGRCLCGAVRYETAWPPVSVMACHCTHCQKQSGSALSIIAMVPRDAVQITGTLTDFHDKGDSGGSVIRRFCGTCGSPVISDIPQEAVKNFVFIKTGTLDDTSDLAPATHLWTNSAQDWFAFPDDAVKVPQQ